MDKKSIIPFLSMPLLLIVVEIGALALSPLMQAAGISAFEDPTSVANPFIFIVILLVFTGFLLLLIKFGFKRVISFVIGASIFFTFIYIFSAIVFAAVGTTDTAVLLVFACSVGATLLLFKYPEWYIIDVLGVLIASGVASIFGRSLDILPVVILLIILAVYDAVSVYRTKHMITLAEGVIDLKTPILFVIPKKRNYSFIREGIGKLGEGHERAAFIMGMGDLIMPSILVVSANVFLTEGTRILGFVIKGTRIFGFINLPALGAIVGSLAGLTVLLYFVNSGKPQAGLPPLNGGTLIGFAVGLGLSIFL